MNRFSSKNPKDYPGPGWIARSIYSTLPALIVIVCLTMSGCGPSGKSANEDLQRDVSDSIFINGFFADLNTEGVLQQRVMAKVAEYDMASQLFLLDNVKVEFYDAKGLTVESELYAKSGVWYTAPRPKYDPNNADRSYNLEDVTPEDLQRLKNDMDLYGDVFHRVIETGSALMTQELRYNSETELLITNVGVVQVVVNEDSMVILQANNFTTDRLFSKPTYQGEASIKNHTYAEDLYREFVPSPPSDAPSYQDYAKN